MIIEIDTQSPLPIYEQLRNQVVLGIARRELVPGEPLPSVRRLGADLGINFHTVNKGYATLCDEGYIYMDRRRGAVVAERTVSSDTREAFESMLKRKLTLSAAEAVCHGIETGEFALMCAECFDKAKENDNDRA